MEIKEGVEDLARVLAYGALIQCRARGESAERGRARGGVTQFFDI